MVVEIIFKGDKDKFKDILKSTFRGTSIKDSKYQMLHCLEIMVDKYGEHIEIQWNFSDVFLQYLKTE